MLSMVCRNRYLSQGGDTAQNSKMCEKQGGGHRTIRLTSVLRVGGRVVFQDNNATRWLHLASLNLPDSQLSWESKMERSVAIKKMERGTPHKEISWTRAGGDTAQLNWLTETPVTIKKGDTVQWNRKFNLGEDTAHKRSKNTSAAGVGGFLYWENNATPWLHLASWNLQDSQPSWVSKMEPSVAIYPPKVKWEKEVKKCVFIRVGGGYYDFAHIWGGGGSCIWS